MKSTSPSHGPKWQQFPAGMQSLSGWVGERLLPSACLMCCGAASPGQASAYLALPWESDSITLQPSLRQHWSCSVVREGWGEALGQFKWTSAAKNLSQEDSGRWDHTKAGSKAPTHAPLSHQTSLNTNSKTKLVRISIMGHFWVPGHAQSHWLKPALIACHEASSATT